MRIIKIKVCSDCPYMEINSTGLPFSGGEILGDYCSQINQYIQDVDIYKKISKDCTLEGE